MTREFRLMLAEQGAADAELMGAVMTTPKSAAEVMREAAAAACRDVVSESAAIIARDGDYEVAVVSGVVASGLMHIIGKLPLPADPRDAEIERLRDVVKRAAKYVCPYDGVGGTISPSAATVSLLAHIRAALAQCGEAGK